ncbi:MAG: hypothetical protein ACTS27_07015 [Phycisphaerales bacterium]
MEERTRNEGRPPQGPRIRYPLLFGILAVVAFIGLLILIVAVTQITTEAEQQVPRPETAPTETATPPAPQPVEPTP